MVPRFLAAADSALLVELGDEVSEAVSEAVLALDARLAAAPPAGVVAVLPTLRSLLVEYDPLRTSHRRLRGDVEALRAHAPASMPRAEPKVHTIAVRYGGEDLDHVARTCGVDAV